MKRIKHFLIVALLVSTSAEPCLAQRRLEGGNSIYRVAVTHDTWIGLEGFIAVFTGPEHPISDRLGRPAQVLALNRDCLICAGHADMSQVVVRSHSSLTDYMLGRNPNPLYLPNPGYTCVDVNASTLPSVSLSADEASVSATWTLTNGSELILATRTAKVLGVEAIGGRVRLELRLENTGGDS